MPARGAALLFLLSLMAVEPRAAMSLFPTSGGPAIPADAPLRLRFDQAVTFARKGALTVFAADTRKAVFTLDFGLIPKAAAATGWPYRRNVGGDMINIHPVILSEREAYIALPRGILAPGKAYYLDLAAGAFVEADGRANAALSGPDAWRFTTHPNPVPGRSAYAIAADGTGDFCTLQGALDFLPSGNNTPVTLSVAPGTYPESIRSIGKHRIRIAGADKDRCVVRYANNEAFNSGSTYRSLARIFGNDILLHNLTFVNDTPNGGTQAEALFLRGERCVIAGCAFISFQDTMLLEGRVFLSECAITGAVDYVWGTGIAFFDRCTLTSNSDGYIVQARNEKGAGGYVFNACTLIATGNARSWLARDGEGRFPDGQVLWIDTRMGAHIQPAGWLLKAPGGTNPGFAEYRSLDSAGNPISLAGRSAFARQLTAAEAGRFRDPSNVLGGKDQWDPRAAAPSGTRVVRKHGFADKGRLRSYGKPAYDLRGARLPAGQGHGRASALFPRIPSLPFDP